MIDPEDILFLVGVSTLGWGVYRWEPNFFTWFLIITGSCLTGLAIIWFSLKLIPDNE